MSGHWLAQCLGTGKNEKGSPRFSVALPGESPDQRLMCRDQVFSQWGLSQVVLVFELLHLWLLILLGQSMQQSQSQGPVYSGGWLEHLVRSLLTPLADDQQVCAVLVSFLLSSFRNMSCHPSSRVIFTYSVWAAVCRKDTECLSSPKDSLF